jgi:hypothetical protein
MWREGSLFEPCCDAVAFALRFVRRSARFSGSWRSRYSSMRLSNNCSKVIPTGIFVDINDCTRENFLMNSLPAANSNLNFFSVAGGSVGRAVPTVESKPGVDLSTLAKFLPPLWR